MKIVTTLAVTAAMLLTVSAASAQCSKSPRTVRNYRPAPTYPTVYQPAPTPSHTVYTSVSYASSVQVVTPPSQGRPVNPIPVNPSPVVQPEADPAGLVTIDVQVQHPLTFAWQTVKSFDDAALANQYAAEIENRHWVVYQQSSTTKYIEASSLASARSKASTLRSTGAKIKAIDRIQVQLTEESFQSIFDDVANEVAAAAPSPVPNELQPLLGLWEAVTKTADGQINRILLDLHADGTADMTVPTASGGEVKINREFAVEQSVFKLKGTSELVLGEVKEAGADKVVLDRNGSLITFLRP